MKDRMILTEYTLCASLPQRLTVGLVSDIHEQDMKEALALLVWLKPDLIMVAGDTFERRDRKRQDTLPFCERLLRSVLFTLDHLFEPVCGRHAHDSEHAYRFLRKAAEIAPVFLAAGNHEDFFLPKDRRVIEESGAVLLDNADCEVRVRGMRVRVGGLSTDADTAWLARFGAKNGYKILLCHHPEYYDRYLSESGADLVLSGHAHGGQIRIRGRGIYAPGQGLFPKYTKGICGDKLIVTTGCANTAAVPRWGNPREVVAVHLTKPGD